MVLENEINIEDKENEKGQGNLLQKPPDILGPSNKPAQTHL